MSEQYLPPVRGGRWAISREVRGRWIAFIEDSPVYEPIDIDDALGALGIATTEHRERYFPVRERDHERCPTLEFLELFAKLGRRKEDLCGV